ncbi:hypothetical protein C0993_011807, partial [Termitomyces sp. T159_Od127]
DLDSSESTSILSSLDQPAPMMEQLEVRLLPDSEHKLPHRLFTMSSRLRHLVLQDCGMTWHSEFINFENLRSLKLFEQTESLLYQLLTILRQTSRLESLHLQMRNRMRDQSNGLVDSSLLRGVDPVILGHLKWIRLVGDLSYCDLLDHIVFSRNARSIYLSIQKEIPNPLAHSLAEKFDNGIEGSTLFLRLRSDLIECWKSKDTTQIPSCYDEPTIFIKSDSILVEAESFLRHLSLDKLTSLEINKFLEEDSWTLFSNLPQLRDLRLRFQDEFLDALQPDVAAILLAGAQSVHMPFPALRNLTMYECDLRYASFSFVSGAELLSSCFGLRRSIGLPLDSLRLEECTRNDIIRLQVELESLRDIIDKVEWTERDDYFEDEDMNDIFSYFEELNAHLRYNYIYGD